MKVKFYDVVCGQWSLSFEYDDLPVPRIGDYVSGFRGGLLSVKQAVWDYSENEVRVYCDC
jgi:hypothetical protein